MKIFKALSVILAALILVSAFTGCHKQPPEEKFRKNTEHIRETESPYLGKIKELVKQSVGGCEEVIIEAGRVDNAPSIIAHVLTTDDYKTYTLKFYDFQEMVVRSLMGEKMPSQEWEENFDEYMHHEFVSELEGSILRFY